MKSGLMTVFLLLFALLQGPAVLAGQATDKRAEADVYYSQQDFKKAYRIYFKLAKTGDHYSQDRIAGMYANGEGKSVDLNKAYAWAVLAEEGGEKFVTMGSGEFLELAGNKKAAKEEALKLQKKYGQQALLKKAIKQAERQTSRKTGASMGSNLSR